MWVLGIVLLLGGAGCLWGAMCAQRRVRAMLAAETLSISEWKNADTRPPSWAPRSAMCVRWWGRPIRRPAAL